MTRTDSPSGPAARLARFRAAVNELGAAAAVVSAPHHIAYLTGYLPGRSPAFLLVRGADAPLLVAGASGAGAVRDIETALYEDYSIHRVIDRRRDAAQALTEAAARCGLAAQGLIAVEVHDLPAFAETALGGRECVDLTSVLRAMRARKDADEQERIRRSVAVTKAGHAAARAAAVAGAKEIEVYAAIQRACVLQAGEPIAFDGDFVSGERAVGIGGPPTDRAMRDGDLFICDLFPTVAGYWADTTRTFAVGAPSPAQRELYDIVRGALERGRAAIRPGLRACDLYQEVRAAIAEAGHAERFPHHAGHGIGLEPHESPWIIPGDDTELRAGMAITLEPGVYLEGVGGVRLEDNYIITEDGAEIIEPYPFGLERA
ncbi:MAG: aminopeptidase P family protein [Armatimonadota bacterium]|nr:MAG: aminopeptidase P family protein [Armatimonadota bacterium]